MRSKYMAEVEEATHELIRHFGSVGLTTQAINMMEKGLTYSDQTIYTWADGKCPSMRSVLAIQQAATNSGNAAILKWAGRVKELLQE